MKFIEFPEMSFKVEGMDEIKVPTMVKIRQKYATDKIEDIKAKVISEMDNLSNKEELKGKRIAITAGSRGIPHVALITKTVCDKLKEFGASPFIVPAMGSHGGGTVEGNLEVINGYGITQEAMGVPILATMEVVLVGEMPDGTPIYCDKNAYEADGIVLLNKIKAHTDFKGEHESGLLKMIAIGLAKHKGASWFHMQGFDTFAKRLPIVAKEFLSKMNVVFGVGLVQNAYDEISEIEIMEKDKIVERDAALLKISKERLAKFKFDNIDVLIVDKIGKNISGEGADPNVTGRGFMPDFKDDFHTQKLFIRGLTEESHHNACGLGLADITTRRCLNDVDWESTWINLGTNTMIDGGKVPMYLNTDKEALMLAIRTCRRIDYNKARVVRIADTLHLDEIEISVDLIPDIEGRSDVEIISQPYEMPFDENGFMIDWYVEK
ncbi:MAG: lactate racemase domain-containing protein [Anaerotignaceae bacterium]